jgi:hypothetical protein
MARGARCVIWSLRFALGFNTSQRVLLPDQRPRDVVERAERFRISTPGNSINIRQTIWEGTPILAIRIKAKPKREMQE